MSNTTLLDIIVEKFSQLKNSLVEDLDEHLTLFDMTDEYKNEIKNKFNSKTKLIFDMEKDGNTFLDFVTKVYGKSNIASFHYIEFEETPGDKNSSDEEGEITSKQLVYLNGNLGLFNKIFDFQKNDLFTYGNYENMRRTEYRFTSFRAQNSNILIKVEENEAYGIFTSHGHVDTIIKIKKDFFKNPVLEMFIGLRLEDDNIDEENVGKICNALNPKKGYLKELKIYQIED